MVPTGGLFSLSKEAAGAPMGAGCCSNSGRTARRILPLARCRRSSSYLPACLLTPIMRRGLCRTYRATIPSMRLSCLQQPATAAPRRASVVSCAGAGGGGGGAGRPLGAQHCLFASGISLAVAARTAQYSYRLQLSQHRIRDDYPRHDCQSERLLGLIANCEKQPTQVHGRHKEGHQPQRPLEGSISTARGAKSYAGRL